MKQAHQIDYQIYGEDMQFVEIELDPQESAVAEAGTMMMMEDRIQMETVFGEGLFFATVEGPGTVWLQSLPFSRLADRIVAASKTQREEGSVLGGLGRLLDGDNR